MRFVAIDRCFWNILISNKSRFKCVCVYNFMLNEFKKTAQGAHTCFHRLRNKSYELNTSNRMNSFSFLRMNECNSLESCITKLEVWWLITDFYRRHRYPYRFIKRSIILSMHSFYYCFYFIVVCNKNDCCNAAIHSFVWNNLIDIVAFCSPNRHTESLNAFMNKYQFVLDIQSRNEKQVCAPIKGK